jgi:hypothetical protein
MRTPAPAEMSEQRAASLDSGRSPLCSARMWAPLEVLVVSDCGLQRARLMRTKPPLSLRGVVLPLAASEPPALARWSQLRALSPSLPAALSSHRDQSKPCRGGAGGCPRRS